MDEEVGQLKQLMTEWVIVTASSMEFCRGRIYGREVVVVRSGVGKVNAGIAAKNSVTLVKNLIQTVPQ